METADTDTSAAAQTPQPRHSNDDDDEHYVVRSDPVLALILINLPPKPLFSFKSVSKRWNSLISSPFFAKTYSAAATTNKLLEPSNSPPWTLLRRRSHDGTLLEQEAHSTTTISTILSTRLPSSDHHQLTVAVCDSAFPVPSNERYQIVSSSNGLLLCRLIVGDTTYYYAILNPVTAQWIVLPPRKCDWNNVSEAFVTKLEPSSLKVIGFKVVLVQYDPSTRDRYGIKYWKFKEEFDMVTYDSETKIWTKSQLRFSFTYHIEGTTRPFCLNGMINWKVWLPCTCIANVAAYDPYGLPDQELRLFDYPTIDEHSGWDDFYNHIHTLIDVIHGKVHYLAIDQTIQVLALWVLEDYHKDEWILKHRFDFNYISIMMLRSNADFYKPLAFHPFDSDIIYLITDEEPNQVMSYSISEEVVSPVCVSAPIRHADEVFQFVIALWPPIVDC